MVSLLCTRNEIISIKFITLHAIFVNKKGEFTKVNLVGMIYRVIITAEKRAIYCMTNCSKLEEIIGRGYVPSNGKD
jgi:hypothetical protein